MVTNNMLTFLVVRWSEEGIHIFVLLKRRVLKENFNFSLFRDNFYEISYILLSINHFLTICRKQTLLFIINKQLIIDIFR